MFDESARVGDYSFDPDSDVETQVAEIAELLRKKLGDKVMNPLTH
jgi:hypothetical protein